MGTIEARELQAAVEDARQQHLDRDPRQLLAWAHRLLGEGLMISTAFGKSGMCILHIAKEVIPEVPVYFLDTGFHFAETLEYAEMLRRDWGLRIIDHRPKLHGVEFVRLHGEKLYETDSDLCCQLNKVEPFRELFGADGRYQGWITGVRRDQASTRAQAEPLEILEGSLLKVQPLALWSRDAVESYLSEHKIPLHPLFSKGYTSIGCAPCTRLPDNPGDERSGRWAGKAKTECGLHTFWKKVRAEEGVAPPASTG